MSILRRQRIWRGLSQKQLSDQTGIDDLDISSFERGTLKPSQDQLQCLAGALQMDMANLLREFSASVAPTVSKAPELTKIKVLENRSQMTWDRPGLAVADHSPTGIQKLKIVVQLNRQETLV